MCNRISENKKLRTTSIFLISGIIILSNCSSNDKEKQQLLNILNNNTIEIGSHIPEGSKFTSIGRKIIIAGPEEAKKLLKYKETIIPDLINLLNDNRKDFAANAILYALTDRDALSITVYSKDIDGWREHMKNAEIEYWNNWIKTRPDQDYINHWPGLTMRKDGKLVDALPEDISVAKSYPTEINKGIASDGWRITIMSLKIKYHVGEEVRIIHVLNANDPRLDVYVMGPKAIYGEYIDGHAATPAHDQDILNYDGLVIKGPYVDYNYDITTYRFDKTDKHTIY
jgi:hypothetical protein